MTEQQKEQRKQAVKAFAKEYVTEPIEFLYNAALFGLAVAVFLTVATVPVILAVQWARG